MIVELAQGAGGLERSFVDADELAALLRGCDALLMVNQNPTPFKTFEARYATKGSLEVTASIDGNNEVRFSVKVGRFHTAESGWLSASQMLELRNMFATADQKIASLPD